MGTENKYGYIPHNDQRMAAKCLKKGNTFDVFIKNSSNMKIRKVRLSQVRNIERRFIVKRSKLLELV